MKQPRISRLWLNDGSCIRLSPHTRNDLWEQVNFVFMRLTAYCVLGERIDRYRKTGPPLILLGALVIVGWYAMVKVARIGVPGGVSVTSCFLRPPLSGLLL